MLSTDGARYLTRILHLITVGYVSLSEVKRHLRFAARCTVKAARSEGYLALYSILAF